MLSIIAAFLLFLCLKCLQTSLPTLSALSRKVASLSLTTAAQTPKSLLRLSAFGLSYLYCVVSSA